MSHCNWNLLKTTSLFIWTLFLHVFKTALKILNSPLFAKEILMIVNQSICPVVLFYFTLISPSFIAKYGHRCFCGHTYGRYGLHSSQSTCDVPCNGDGVGKCGANLANAVYDLGRFGVNYTVPCSRGIWVYFCHNPPEWNSFKIMNHATTGSYKLKS